MNLYLPMVNRRSLKRTCSREKRDVQKKKTVPYYTTFIYFIGILVEHNIYVFTVLRKVYEMKKKKNDGYSLLLLLLLNKTNLIIK